MSDVIERVAICGAGAMGSGIAQVAAHAGATVVIFDAATTALDAGRERVASSLNTLAKRGRLSAQERQSILDRMSWTSSVDDMGSAQLVIEAIVEDEGIKRILFENVERVIAPHAILASNTSSLSISKLAASLEHPTRFVGMHFFNPAQMMKLVEVVAGKDTSPSVLKTVIATSEEWGKVAVAVADVPGFIVNRVARPLYAEAFAAMGEAAATPEVIDHLFRSAAGFRMGPLELTDLIGQDVNYAVAQSIFDAYGGRTRYQPQEAQASLVEAGRLGRKTGEGVYSYPVTQTAPISGHEQASATGSSEREAYVTAFNRLMERRSSLPHEEERVDGIVVKWGEGKTASREAALHGCDVAILDWSNGSANAPVGFAASSDAAAETVTAMAAALDLQAFRIADRPGLLVLRTLAQLANAACDAVSDRVADEAAIDAAMRFGGNYPFGPFEWSDVIGRDHLANALSNIAEGTGSSQYSPSSYLKKFASVAEGA